MHLNPSEDTESQPTPSLGPTPGPSPQPLLHPEIIINITAAIWESVFNRMAKQDMTIAKQNETLESLAMDHRVLQQRHAARE
jgi:hypothetical protein